MSDRYHDENAVSGRSTAVDSSPASFIRLPILRRHLASSPFQAVTIASVTSFPLPPLSFCPFPPYACFSPSRIRPFLSARSSRSPLRRFIFLRLARNRVDFAGPAHILCFSSPWPEIPFTPLISRLLSAVYLAPDVTWRSAYVPASSEESFDYAQPGGIVNFTGSPFVAHFEIPFSTDSTRDYPFFARMTSMAHRS